MANLVYMAKSAWTGLLDAIRSKAGTAASMTVSQAQTAVENIPTGGGDEDFINLVERLSQHPYSFSNSQVSVIGKGAFAYFDYLYNVDFPNATNIGAYAFLSCYNMAFVNIPKAQSIQLSCFQNCSKLLGASFPEASDIGNGAFSSCVKMETAYFPSAKAMGQYAFVGCRELKSITCPELSRIANYVFSGAGLSSFANDKLTLLNVGAFSNCQSLTAVSFPSVTKIEDMAFANCFSLSDVSFPEVMSIGTSAFSQCKELRTISLPKLVSMSNSVFYRCYNLLSVYLLGSTRVSIAGSAVFSSTPIAGYTTSTGGVYGSIFVPSSLYDQYISASYWSFYSSRIVSM